MIQLRRIRSFVNKDNAKIEYDTCFEPDIMIENVKTLLDNLDSYIQQIPGIERFNCHYTLGDSQGGKTRGKNNFIKQDVIVFDLDKIRTNEQGEYDPDYIKVFFEVTKLDPTKTVAVFSGNGLHFVILLTEPITDSSYFKRNKSAYTKITEALTTEYKKREMLVELDPLVFAPNRMLRLPNTFNLKDGKPKRFCHMIDGYKNLEPQVFEMMHNYAGDKADGSVKKTKKRGEKKEEGADDEAQTTKIYKPADTPSVLEGCNFLKWMKQNPNDVNEGQWYAGLSILGRLKNGRELAHEYSKGHQKYSQDETNRKFDQSMENAGPRTCKRVAELWKDCSGCPHFGKIKTPLQIRPADEISTQETGFHYLKKGEPKPHYEDLKKFFGQKYNFISKESTGGIYIYDGKKYSVLHINRIREFANDHFDPKPMEATVTEFRQRLSRSNVRGEDFFDKGHGFINFQNGVLEIDTGKFLEHSPDFGFLYVLPYNYDPNAKCPEFDSMMKRITLNRPNIENLLLEFTGYGICNRQYKWQKAIILVGDGANGKSTFLDIVQGLAGDENVDHLSLNEMQSDTYRSKLEGKLINISEEMPQGSIKNSELFKKIMGGTVIIRKLYENPGSMRNTAKFFFACNTIPTTPDNTTGFYRRFLPVPFDATFKDDAMDFGLKDRILKNELSGIFNKVLEAYKGLMARGWFDEPKECVEMKNNYRLTNDFTGTWIEENLEVVKLPAPEGFYCKLEEIYANYTGYCSKTGEKAVSRTLFVRDIQLRVKDFKERQKRIHPSKTTQYRIIEGIRYCGDHDSGHMNGHAKTRGSEFSAVAHELHP